MRDAHSQVASRPLPFSVPTPGHADVRIKLAHDFEEHTLDSSPVPMYDIEQPLAHTSKYARMSFAQTSFVKPAGSFAQQRPYNFPPLDSRS